MDIVEHALLGLHMTISQNSSKQGRIGLWWETLNREYDAKAGKVRERFPGALDDYERAFAAEIESAARSIHQRLQENPVVLNTLRATRLGTDVAGIVIAVKTGAVGVSEALLTPAMLSVTSILAESAVGKYVDSVRSGLKQQQYDLVEDLLRSEFVTPLAGIQLDRPGLFNMDERRLEQMQSARQGLLF